MTIAQDDRGSYFGLKKANGRDSFREHNEQMKMFHRSHGDVDMVNGRRYDKPSLLEVTQPLQIPRLITRIDTGGTKRDISDWWVLVDALQVAEQKLSQN